MIISSLVGLARQNPGSLIAVGAFECREAVRLVIRSGADLVKVGTTGGIGGEMDPFEEIAHLRSAMLVVQAGVIHRHGTCGQGPSRGLR